MDFVNKLETIKKILADYFSTRKEVLFAYIFGSTAMGTANKLSDIDVAIYVDKLKINEQSYRYGYRAEVLTDLIKMLKTNEVDLVILNYATVLLKHRVLYNGILLHSADEKERIRFQVDTINKYMDYKMLANKKIS